MTDEPAINQRQIQVGLEFGQVHIQDRWGVRVSGIQRVATESVEPSVNECPAIGVGEWFSVVVLAHHEHFMPVCLDESADDFTADNTVACRSCGLFRAPKDSRHARWVVSHLYEQFSR